MSGKKIKSKFLWTRFKNIFEFKEITIELLVSRWIFSLSVFVGGLFSGYLAVKNIISAGEFFLMIASTVFLSIWPFTLFKCPHCHSELQLINPVVGPLRVIAGYLVCRNCKKRIIIN